LIVKIGGKRVDHECSNCVHGIFIEADIDIWDWYCSYSHFPNEDECNDIYEDDESM
jgi:hypothetical protein